MEEIIKELLKDVPLKSQLFTLNHMMIQSYLTDIGYIPDGYWTDEKEKKYGKSLYKFAKKLTKAQMDTIKRWEKNKNINPHKFVKELTKEQKNLIKQRKKDSQ